jgi:hypothetical protein
MKKVMAIITGMVAVALVSLSGCTTANNSQAGTSYTNSTPQSTVGFPDAPAASTDVTPIPPPAGQGNQPDRPPQ